MSECVCVCVCVYCMYNFSYLLISYHHRSCIEDSLCVQRRHFLCSHRKNSLGRQRGGGRRHVQTNLIGLYSSPAQSSKEANCCQVIVDEMGLLKLKLTILAVLSVILGSFLVAFQVLCECVFLKSEGTPCSLVC